MGGVNISLDGTEHYVHTDHIGHYILEGISVGTINLKASKIPLFKCEIAFNDAIFSSSTSI